MKAEMHVKLQRRSRRSGERIIANQMNVSKMDGYIHTRKKNGRNRCALVFVMNMRAKQIEKKGVCACTLVSRLSLLSLLDQHRLLCT